jgi:hypothetical protein
MTHPDEDELEALRQRLRDFYERQIASARATQSVAAGAGSHRLGRPVGGTRARAPMGLVLAGTVVVVVAALLLRPGMPQTGSTSTSTSSTASASRSELRPSSTAAASPKPDGRIPASIGPEPVLVGEEIAAHAAAATGDSPFLVGGVVGPLVQFDCSRTWPPTLLVGACGDGPVITSVSPDMAALPNSYPSGTVYTHFSPSHPSVADIGRQGDIVVYRVHVRDPLAAQCPADWAHECLAAIVIEKLVWINGSLVGGQ